MCLFRLSGKRHMPASATGSYDAMLISEWPHWNYPTLLNQRQKRGFQRITLFKELPGDEEDTGESNRHHSEPNEFREEARGNAGMLVSASFQGGLSKHPFILLTPFLNQFIFWESSRKYDRVNWEF